MLTISEQIKKLRDLAELCASTSDHMMAKYLNDAADTIERLLKSYMDIKAEIKKIHLLIGMGQKWLIVL